MHMGAGGSKFVLLNVFFSSCDFSIYLSFGQLSLRAGAFQCCLEAGSLGFSADYYQLS